MPPEIVKSGDPITPPIVKWIVFPVLIGIFGMMALSTQMDEWKCSREAKRQGFLEGHFYPAYRFTPAICVCKKKIRDDGTIDNFASLTINLDNKKLNW